jgi:hypothetical protein
MTNCTRFIIDDVESSNLRPSKRTMHALRKWLRRKKIVIPVVSVGIPPQAAQS